MALPAAERGSQARRAAKQQQERRQAVASQTCLQVAQLVAGLHVQLVVLLGAAGRAGQGKAGQVRPGKKWWVLRALSLALLVSAPNRQLMKRVHRRCPLPQLQLLRLVRLLRLLRLLPLT